MTQVTINGNTYSSAGESAKDMRSGGFRQHLLPMLNDVVTVAGQVQTDADNASNASGSAQSAATSAAASAALATAIALGAAFPNIRPGLLLDFANSQRIDPRITFTRNSTATRINQNGLLEIVPANMPRLDYDLITGECLGLLMEEQRTNHCLYNRDLTNAAWVKTNCTPALTQTGVDGAANAASLLTADADNATCLQTITLGYSNRATSAFIKRSAGSGSVFMTTDNGATWTDISASLNSSTFTRCSIPYQFISNPVVGFKLATAGDAIIVDFVQNETGEFVTSAMPTTSAAFTRVVDKASLEGINFNSWYSQIRGTFVAEFRWLFTAAPVGYFGRVIEAHDGTLNETINIRASAASILGSINDGGVSQVSSSIGAASADIKACFAYKTNDAQLAVNGVAVATDTAGTLPTPTKLYIGSQYNGGNPGSFHLSRLAYYPKRLTESELQGLSTL